MIRGFRYLEIEARHVRKRTFVVARGGIGGPGSMTGLLFPAGGDPRIR